MPSIDKLKVNPWVSIWVRPRDTIRKIIDFDPGYRFALLSGIYGFPLLLQISQNFSLGQSIPIFIIILIALCLSVFVGMLVISIESALLLWTGRWLGGVASYKEIRAAVAWSNVPNIVTIATWIIFLAIFGQQAFFYEFPEGVFTGSLYSILFLLSLIQLIISIWSLIIFLQALGEVQGFSAWKALLNAIIPFVIVVLAIWIIGTFVMWAVSLNGVH
jgi:hypothetical protein